MARYADTMEKLVGRKTVSCFGFVLFILLALIILALAWPHIFPDKKEDRPARTMTKEK
jgi:hypothetical protein